MHGLHAQTDPVYHVIGMHLQVGSPGLVLRATQKVKEKGKFQVVPERIGDRGQQVDLLTIDHRRDIRTTHEQGSLGNGEEFPELIRCRIFPE